jgi:hypothetical protein
VKTAIHKATEVIVETTIATVDLYRELTLSALRLLPGRS